ncbi:hypothetical protein [Nocardioides sp. Root190]|uniref:hypothetical protein n=1 Tax=Nocardioides sp. Root190 TaxID=1736488 RepID=UPI000A5AE69B|nr:hypothetical protein [Nocardioides sp. Root190]
MPQTSRKNAPAPAPVPVPVGRIDVPNAVRGASTGFSILLIGGFLAPMLTLVSTLTAGIWLALVAIVAFAIAARRSQRAGIPALHGIFAALLSYALVLPLLLPFEQGRDLQQIAQTALTAVIVGAITGAVASRRVVVSSQRPRRTLVRRTGPVRRVGA